MAAAGSQTVKQALAGATLRLEARHSQSPRLDAELLLAEALGASREALYAEPDRVLTATETEAFEALVKRREHREPVAYILGRKRFRGVELRLNEDTLIPRPETETLVAVALEKLAACGKEEPRVLDLGTGSGNIALALCDEHPTVRVVATEVHPAPLEMARLNARELGFADRVEFEVSDLYDDLPKGARFDLIVSNPPYVTQDALRRLAVDVRGFEPHVALLGGPHGLDFYERIVPGAPEFLEPGGWLAVEIPETRFVEVMALFVAVGCFEDIDLRHDLGDRPRVIVARERPAG